MSSKLVNRSVKFGRILTSPLRMMPSFLLIGAQKCGTTSLFNYLLEHPSVCAPVKKEVGYFSSNFDKGIEWYQSFFPIVWHKDRQYITGEASTGYIYHPHARHRIADTIPQVKLIALLRNPVDRAYSHYHHTARMGKEELPFAEAIEREEERIEEIKAKMLEDGNYYDKSFHYYTYLSRGIYVEQLKPWLELFPRQQLLILKSEDFFAQPALTLQRVLNFLELPHCNLQHFPKHNPNRYQDALDPTTREKLSAYFRPHNQRLYELLRLNFDWD